MTANIEKVEKQLDELIQGQKRQAENDKTVLSEVKNLKKAFERLHERFDEIHEKTIIHDEKIKVLEQKSCAAEKMCKNERELIWNKMREHKNDAIITAKKDMKLWIYAALLTGFGAIALTFIKDMIVK